MSTYTGFVRFYFDNSEEFAVEEIDVQASHTEEARWLVQQELDADYEPGGVIVHIEQRVNPYA